MADDEGRIEVDPSELRALLNGLKSFEPMLARSTRRRLRKSGQETIADMSKTVMSNPAHRNVGVRAGIAAGLRTSVATGKRRQGVRIQGTASKIPSAHKPMLRLYNKESFRHPVFGSAWWIIQPGHPFFGSTIKRHEEDMVDEIKEALSDAIKAVLASR